MTVSSPSSPTPKPHSSNMGCSDNSPPPCLPMSSPVSLFSIFPCSFFSLSICPLVIWSLSLHLTLSSFSLSCCLFLSTSVTFLVSGSLPSVSSSLFLSVSLLVSSPGSISVFPLLFFLRGPGPSSEPAGGVAERHEGGRDPPASHVVPNTPHRSPPSDVRAQHPQPAGQQGHRASPHTGNPLCP